MKKYYNISADVLFSFFNAYLILLWVIKGFSQNLFPL